MGFWDTATQALPVGVGLGVRSAERAEDRVFKEREMGLREEEGARRTTEFERSTKEYNAKELSKRAKNTITIANAYWDNGQKQQALGVITKFYNTEVPNGDEAMGMVRDAENPEGDSGIWSDPKFKDTEIAVLSKKNGAMSFKNFSQLKKTLLSKIGEQDLTAAMEENARKLNELNTMAAMKPFLSDGKPYIKTFVDSPTGPKPGPDMPYTGKMEDIKREPYTLKEGDERHIPLAGGGEKVVKGSGTGKKEYNDFLDRTKKEYDYFAKAFTGKVSGSDFFDTSGQPAQEATNAYDKAADILIRKKKGEKLTDLEESKVNAAGEFLMFYNDSRAQMQQYRNRMKGGAPAEGFEKPKGKPEPENIGLAPSHGQKSKEKPKPSKPTVESKKKPSSETGITSKKKPKETKENIPASELDLIEKQVKGKNFDINVGVEEAKKWAKSVSEKIEKGSERVERPIQYELRRLGRAKNNPTMRNKMAELLRISNPGKSDEEIAEMLRK